MDKRTQELAEQAGFIFWKDEPWGPGRGHIDWSCNYDKEFDRFNELMKKEQNNMNTKPITEALKTWTVTTEEDLDTGDVLLPLPEEILVQNGWEEGDTLEFKDNLDGTFTLSKKKQETELVLVDTVSSYRVRYLVEVPKGKKEWALDTVTMEDAKEFSQEYLGEQIASHRVVTEAEALKILDEDNEYTASWPTELKKKNFFTSLEDQNLNCD